MDLEAHDVSVLEEYERPVSSSPIKPLVWSIEKYEVAQLLAISGYTIAKISEVTTVPITAIKKWKQHPDFIKYMDDCLSDTSVDLKKFRIGLLRKVISARVDRVEEMGGDYSILSTKDTADLLAELRKETEKNEDKEQTQYMRTIEALLLSSAAPKQIGSGQ